MGDAAAEHAWRRQRPAVGGDRPHMQQPAVHRRHLRTVGRPRGPGAAAGVDRLAGDRREPLACRRRAVRRRFGGEDVDLVAALAEAFRVRRHQRHRDGAPVRRPARVARLRQRRLHAGDLAAVHLDHRDASHAPAPVHVEEGDPATVGRPGRAQRLGGQMGELAVRSAGEVADPQLRQVAALVRGIDKAAAVGCPCRIGIQETVAGDIAWRPSEWLQIDVAECGEGELAAVRRQRRLDDARGAARRGRIEIARTSRILRAGHLQGRVEGHRGCRRGRAGAVADQAVGHVVEALATPRTRGTGTRSPRRIPAPRPLPGGCRRHPARHRPAVRADPMKAHRACRPPPRAAAVRAGRPRRLPTGRNAGRGDWNRRCDARPATTSVRGSRSRCR